MDYSIRIGGEAGQGVQTIGETLSKVFSRCGFHVFAHQDYESRVRGGHNFYQVRVSDRPVFASGNTFDVLAALDSQSIRLHSGHLNDGGRIVYDSASIRHKHDGAAFLDVPFAALAVDHGGRAIMANVVAVGTVLGLFGTDIEVLNGIIGETFAGKGADVVKANMDCAAAGYAFARSGCVSCGFSASGVVGARRMLISGTDAMALGAIGSGCRFYTAYPMTPSTGIMNCMASKAMQYGIVVEQAEDEIAAVNMALGASFAGVRSMTASSGGGFALMVEGVSLAAMTETPLVIALGQRPGPATGLPTRTEQGELQFVLHCGHGEFPRVVFAPGDPEQAFYLVNRAFDLAEKYQIPVFVLFDAYLADALWTFDSFDASRLLYRDYRIRGEAFSALSAYKRHAFTADGVSPLGVPGEAPHVVATDSDEHDEAGHMIEDAATRVLMTEKRFFNKMPMIKKEIAPPLYYGPPEPEVVLTGWGSTYGVMREAVDLLSETKRAAMIHFSELYPLPSNDGLDWTGILRKASRTFCIENNASGQFAQLVRTETGFVFSDRINRFDGRPFSIEDLVGEIHERLG